MNLFSKLLKRYSYLLGLILFAFVLLKLNFGEVWQSVENVQISYLIIAALAAFPILFFKSWCWNYILKVQGINYNLKDSFLMYCAGMYLGVPTPGRVGEMAMAFYLKKDGNSFGKSLVSIFLDRVSDLAFLVGFIILGSLFFVSVWRKEILIFFSGLAILAMLVLALTKTGTIKWILKKAFYFFIPEKKQNNWKVNFQDFISDFKIFNLKSYTAIMLITALSWSAYFFQMYVLAWGVGLHVPWIYLSVTVTITGLITIIPVSISGIGTRDVALILLLAPFLIPKEQAIVFSALILFMSLLAALIGLVCWFIKPIKL